jgi:putative flippase GtrA
LSPGQEKLVNLFLRFSAVGATGTAVHYVVLTFLVWQFDISPPLSAVIGASCGALVNYYLNREYNFSGGGEHRRAVPRFLVLVVIGVFLNGMFVNILAAGGLHFLVAQAFATLFILGLNFIVCKKWIFIKN